jgi:hypothetical protein
MSKQANFSATAPAWRRRSVMPRKKRDYDRESGQIVRVFPRVAAPDRDNAVVSGDTSRHRFITSGQAYDYPAFGPDPRQDKTMVTPVTRRLAGDKVHEVYTVARGAVMRRYVSLSGKAGIGAPYHNFVKQGAIRLSGAGGLDG